jgi:hypothetical protein
MTRQFTVSCRTSNAAGPDHRAVLASLPEHFRVVADGHADAAYTSLESPPAGARVLVCDCLGTARPATRIPTIPAWTYLPRMEADACFAEARGRSFEVISCLITVADTAKGQLRHALLEQLAVLRTLTGAEPSIDAFQHDARGYRAVVRIGRAAGSMIGRVSPLAWDTLQLDAVGKDHRLDITMDAETLARPANIRLFGAGGLRQAMPNHQSSHRLTWLKVHAFLCGSAPASELPTVNPADAEAVARSFDAA